MTDTDALRERAAALGYCLKRRGQTYRLINRERSVEIAFDAASAVDFWLSTVERKETECGLYSFKKARGRQ
jgi:hypothetical protein